MIDGLVYDVTRAKQGFADALGVESSILHVPFGLALFGLFCLAFCGVRHGARWALVGVLGVQVLNEVFDAVQWLRWTGVVNWPEAFGDVVLTMAAPLVVVVARDLRRGRLAPERGR